MNKVRKIFFFLASNLSACLSACFRKFKKKNLNSNQTYITLEQKEMLWTRELQELFKKKKVLPLEKYS